jgi:HEAT repeat protein
MRLLPVLLAAGLLIPWRNGASATPTPAAADILPGIVFVSAPVFDEKTDIDNGVLGSHFWRDGNIYHRAATFHRGERTIGPPRTGRNLYALVPARPDGKLTRLTHLTSGAVFKPEPYFDGKKVLFSMRRDSEDWFHLYEINIDGANLRQLTDGPFNDFAGVYLPDGRIVFCSDRTGYLEEYHEERTECLFVMKGDGTGIEQITFLPGTYYEPTVLQDGRILFSFWDAFHIDVPPLEKHETYLMTVNPDGTEERHLFGAGQYRFFNRERHSGVGLSQPREMPDGRILAQSEMGPSQIDLRHGLIVRDALSPIFPGTTSIQVGGTTNRVHLSPLGTKSTAYPLPDGRILYSGTLPGARDSAIYTTHPDTREERLVVNIPGQDDFDAVPVLVERPKPNMLPTARASAKRQASAPELVPSAKFLVVAGHATDNPERTKALRKARYFRVIEAEYTGVTTASHTNLETRILGVVPVFNDGSSYFEAPADTPIFLDPLDAAGNRILYDWPYENTAVAKGLPYAATQLAYMSARPWETRSCYGCHAPQTDAVPNVKALALAHPPVKIIRASTNIEYRRNEPDAYRTQARLGDDVKYRPWLKSKDPVLRARACEMLMSIEDGAEQDVPAIGRLLKDADVEVRRTAALALTRLATVSQKELLFEVAKKSPNEDWLVRFHAQAALDVLEPFGSYPASERLGEQYRGPLGYSPTYFESFGRMPGDSWAKQNVLAELKQKTPHVQALRAAGKLKLADAVPLLVPWLKRHEYEYHAAEAAYALGRIGTPEAIAALWEAVRSEVPNKQVLYNRYLQHGPRPEEYALIKALILANAVVTLEDLHLLIALLPNTFMEKPRFEDRLRDESQRVLMPRMMLERAGFRRRSVEILIDALAKKPPLSRDAILEREIIKGINLERPFSEHGRLFPVIKEIGPEEAIWLLGCLIDPASDCKNAADRQQLEDLVVPHLTSTNPRERIDAAVFLGIIGFGRKTEKALAAEIAKPYSFPEITSIGQGMPGTPLRDKAYMAYALARHAESIETLEALADPKTMPRDVRYGLVRGLAKRAKFSSLSLLNEMASRDPLTLIRQQARHGIADILDVYRLSGKDAPHVTLREPRPLEALYPPRGLTWSKIDNVPPSGSIKLASRFRALDELLVPKNFRNLNIAFVSGAQQMMIDHVEETHHAIAALAKYSGPAATKQLLAVLDTPYPTAHALAAQAMAQRGDSSAAAILLTKLDDALKKQDFVSYWAYADALGQLRAKEAIPFLAKHAVPTNPPCAFGPPGMAIGYVSAAALARIVGDAQHPDVVRFLKEENIWMRAGALRGLAEAKAPGITELLRDALEDEAAVVRQEATVQLRSLQVR